MFEELSAKFEDALKSLRGEDKITDSNIDTSPPACPLGE
jgi:signal recognition particle GTPase